MDLRPVTCCSAAPVVALLATIVGLLIPAHASARWSMPSLSVSRCMPTGLELSHSLFATEGDRRLTGEEISRRGVRLEYLVDGVPEPARLNGDAFEYVIKAGNSPRTFTLAARLIAPDETVTTDTVRIEVVPDTRLMLTASVDFGAVDSGCGAEARCIPLDLATSSGLGEGVRLAFRREAVEPGAGWEDLGVRVRSGDEVRDVARGTPVELPYLPGTPVEVCYAPPRCVAPPSPPSERLVVEPRSECLEIIDRKCRDEWRCGTERGAATNLLATVTPNGWLECWFWWIVGAIGLIVAGFVVWGFVSPSSFPAAGMVRVANSERALLRDPGRPLRTVTGGRRGFYRSASCCFSPEGMTVARSKPHVVALHALPGNQVRLSPAGALVERLERRKWIRVDPAGGPDAAAERFVSSGTPYRVNGAFYFQVDC